MNGYENDETYFAANAVLNDEYYLGRAQEAVEPIVEAREGLSLSPDSPERMEDVVDALRQIMNDFYEELGEPLEDVSNIVWSDLIDTLAEQ